MEADREPDGSAEGSSRAGGWSGHVSRGWDASGGERGMSEATGKADAGGTAGGSPAGASAARDASRTTEMAEQPSQREVDTGEEPSGAAGTVERRTAVSRDAFDQPREWLLLNALVLGLRDYMRKTGFRECVLGLSGGIDSSLAAYIAARACGPRRVHGLLMPSRYSSEHSVRDARALAEALRIDAAVVPIEEVHRAYERLPIVGPELLDEPAGLADQNLQARIRGAIVMFRSNRHGWLPLSTGNKSELAVGYCTLYGDMAGGFAVLCDLYKQDVYALARFINEAEGREVIPEHVLVKPPSAELAPGQVDQDALPPYPLLDGILRELIEREAAPQELFDRFPRDVVLWVARRLDRNEFKRRQLPPGIKLTARAFGSGRRMPIAARWDPANTPW
ncbi:MAG: NAD(+) synthase [Planctomycetota bacterium]|nr:MAG: NAD(+) synthase [Planctomycetota bacterium]